MDNIEQQPANQLSWGYGQAPDNAIAAWGARAIYKLEVQQNRFFGNGKRRKTPKTETVASIDLLWDRMSSHGEDQARKDLATWINGIGLPKLRKLCVEEYVTGDSDAVIEFEGNGFYLRASPRESYGYLYITAWKVP